MTWTSNGFFRNANFIKILEQTSRGDPVVVYQPGTLNPLSIEPERRYSGFLMSIRVRIDISSIAEVQFPAREPGMSPGELSAQLRGMDAVSPKFQMDLLACTHSNPEWEMIGSVMLYNRRPFYTINLMPYLTDAASFDVASDCAIGARITDAGYGLLRLRDRVSIFGSAVEEVENSAPSLTINVRGGSGGGDGTANAIVTADGSRIIDSRGNSVVYG